MIAVRANDDAALVRKLMDDRIVTSSRDGKLRAGFPFYNNHVDVDHFVGALLKNAALLERVSGG